VYCEDGCHQIKPKYGMPRVGRAPRPPISKPLRKKEEAAIHFK